MKRPLFIITFLLLSCMLSGQKPEITFGKELRLPSGTYFEGFSTQLGDTVYLLRRGSNSSLKKIALEKYHSETLKFLGEVSFFDTDQENRFFALRQFDNGSLALLSTQVIPENKTKVLFIQLFDLNGNPVSDRQAISSFSLKEELKTGSFKVNISENGSKLLVITQISTAKYSNEKVNLAAFGNDLDLLWSTEVELSYPSQSFSIMDQRMDGNDNVIILASAFPVSYTGKERGVASDNYLIFTYNQEKNELQEFEINLERKWVSELSLSISPESHTILTGYYSTNREHKANGVFYLKIDPASNAILASNLHEFSSNTLRHFMKEKEAESKQGIADMGLINVFSMKDKVILIGEQSYTLEECYTQFRTGITTCDYHHYHYEVLLVELNREGKLIGTSVIPKKQHTVNDKGYHNSFIAWPVNEEIHFLYNDDPGNTELYGTGNTEFMNNPSRAHLTLATWGKENKFRYKGLLPSKRDGNIFTPYLLHADGNKLFLYFSRNRNFKIAKLSF